MLNRLSKRKQKKQMESGRNNVQIHLMKMQITIAYSTTVSDKVCHNFVTTLEG